MERRRASRWQRSWAALALALAISARAASATSSGPGSCDGCAPLAPHACGDRALSCCTLRRPAAGHGASQPGAPFAFTVRGTARATSFFVSVNQALTAYVPRHARPTGSRAAAGRRRVACHPGRPHALQGLPRAPAWCRRRAFGTQHRRHISAVRLRAHRAERQEQRRVHAHARGERQRGHAARLRGRQPDAVVLGEHDAACGACCDDHRRNDACSDDAGDDAGGGQRRTAGRRRGGRSRWGGSSRAAAELSGVAFDRPPPPSCLRAHRSLTSTARAAGLIQDTVHCIHY